MKLLKWALASGAGVCLLSGTSLTAAATPSEATYSATRSNSVRLVWRRSMGRHALYAAKGSRYSEHLGIDYGPNSATPSRTWYTNAHEVLVDRATGQELLYYHVNDATGQHGGWIWHGYLTAKPTLSSHAQWVNMVQTWAQRRAALSPAKTPIAQQDWSAVYQAWNNGAAGWEPDSQKLLELFPKSTFDYRLQDSVNRDLLNGLVSSQRTGPSTPAQWQTYLQTIVPTKQFRVVDQAFATDPDSSASIDQALSAVGLTAAVRDQYQGWDIGATIVSPDEDSDYANPGNILIYLVRES